MELSDQDIAVLQRVLNAVRNISGPGVISGGGTINIHPPRVRIPPPPGEKWRWIRLMSPATGAALYNARQQKVQASPPMDPSTDFDAGDFFEDVNSSGNDCLFRNLDESGFPSGVHFLNSSGSLYLPARRAPADTNDSPAKPVYELNAGAGPVAVTLSSPSGSAGANGPPPTAAAYTYTVTLASGGSAIGTDIAVWPARQPGHVTAATKGYADVIGGTLYIVQHDEVIDTGSSCT